MKTGTNVLGRWSSITDWREPSCRALQVAPGTNRPGPKGKELLIFYQSLLPRQCAAVRGKEEVCSFYSHKGTTGARSSPGLEVGKGWLSPWPAA